MRVVLVLTALIFGEAGLAVAQPTIEGCPVFPADNIWNRAVDMLPKAGNSDVLIDNMGRNLPLHADFGHTLNQRGIFPGIPFVVVPGTQKKVKVEIKWESESDLGGYPIPPNPPIEGGAHSKGDRHVIVVDRDRCKLYEIFAANPRENGNWTAAAGAIFDLRSNKLREEGWTSGDAAGLPIFPGLVRYDEVTAGELRHAVRFTVVNTRKSWIWPARHYASEFRGEEYPPMGTRVRLRADFPLDGFSPEIQVILRALKKYGMMLADNGPAWDITGTQDERWNEEHLKELAKLHGGDFEVVDVQRLMVKRDSAQAK